MSTKKRQRKYSQDFSGGSLTDQSFGPACDVNAIVRHYEKTGIDPHQGRIASARYEEASTLSYEDAMRNKAELDSHLAELSPDQLNELNAPQAQESPESDPIAAPAETAPQDASGGDQGD